MMWVNYGRSLAALCATFCLILLSACGSTPTKAPIVNKDVTHPTPRPATSPTYKPSSSVVVTLPKAESGRGGYYQDDGPGDNPPPNLESVVEPIPMVESYSRSGNRPYVVFGKTYTPITDTTTPFKQRGIGSWYGKKFHGKRTSSGEPYDMYKITAAHPTLPIPSYARVTNLANGKQIIVRINDRGPFHSSRIVDLSYTAALKLDYLGKGSSELEVERLLPADIERMAENRNNLRPQPIVALPAKPVSIVPLAPAPVVSGDAPLAGNAYYLQFGAFAIRANAEAVLSRIQSRAQQGLPALEIAQQGSLYRLYCGPFASRNDALDAMNQAETLGVGKPLVVQR
jgi:rare lipoprotein A